MVHGDRNSDELKLHGQELPQCTSVIENRLNVAMMDVSGHVWITDYCRSRKSTMVFYFFPGLEEIVSVALYHCRQLEVVRTDSEEAKVCT